MILPQRKIYAERSHFIVLADPEKGSHGVLIAHRLDPGVRFSPNQIDQVFGCAMFVFLSRPDDPLSVVVGLTDCLNGRHFSMVWGHVSALHERAVLNKRIGGR